MGEIKNSNKILVGKSEGKIQFGGLGVDGSVILTRSSECGLDSTGPGYCPVAGCCEHVNKSLGFTKGRGSLDYQLLQKGPASLI
jgi:hypothetical protein